MRKPKAKLDKESNPTAYNRLVRYRLKCPICPPNKGENCNRHAKHGKTKARDNPDNAKN